MNNDLYHIFELRLAHLWRFERNLFISKSDQRLDDKTINELLDHCQFLTGQSEQSPLLTTKAYDEGDHNAQRQYARYAKEVVEAAFDLGKRVKMDVFGIMSDFYGYDNSIIITPELVGRV